MACRHRLGRREGNTPFPASVHSHFCVAVDEEDEYECMSVLNSHTQDVKHVIWHPNQEVSSSLPFVKKAAYCPSIFNSSTL